MHHHTKSRTSRRVVIITVVVLVASSGLAGSVAGSQPDRTGESGRAVNPISGVRDTHAANVTVQMNCTQNRIEVTAPPTYQYAVSLTRVNVTPTTSRTTRLTTATVTGNLTRRIPPADVVGVFVLNSSRDTPIVQAVTVCQPHTDLTVSPTPPETQPQLQVNCTTGVVRVRHPAADPAVVSVTVLKLTPSQTATSRLTQTIHGNATIQVATQGVIAAFLSPETRGAADTTTVIRDCGAPSRNTSTSLRPARIPGGRGMATPQGSR